MHGLSEVLTAALTGNVANSKKESGRFCDTATVAAAIAAAVSERHRLLLPSYHLYYHAAPEYRRCWPDAATHTSASSRRPAATHTSATSNRPPIHAKITGAALAAAFAAKNDDGPSPTANLTLAEKEAAVIEAIRECLGAGLSAAQTHLLRARCLWQRVRCARANVADAAAARALLLLLVGWVAAVAPRAF